MHWLRLWNRMLESRKVQTLPPETFKAWINLLCLASKRDEDGRLPSVADMAWSLRLSEQEMELRFEALCDAGLIEMIGGVPRIHGWENWQKPADDSLARVRRYRERKKLLKMAETEPPIDPTSHQRTARYRAMPYEQYLSTVHWQKVRKFAIEACGGRCSLCNRDGEIQVHHRTYENLGNERPSDVVGLCADCHKTFHANGGLAKAE